MNQYLRGRRDMLRSIIKWIGDLDAGHQIDAMKDPAQRQLWRGASLNCRGILAGLKAKLEAERLVERTPASGTAVLSDAAADRT